MIQNLIHLRRRLSEIDRALIDAAIAEVRVRRIPMGVTSLDPTKGRSWSEVAAQFHENRLRGERLRMAPSQRELKRQRREARRLSSAELNQRLAALAAEGLTCAEIGRVVGLARNTVWKRLDSIGVMVARAAQHGGKNAPV